jgi:hypothetical protein
MEFYQLIDCITSEPFEIAGQPVYFEFDGNSSSPTTHPDVLQNKVLTSITTEADVTYTGCWSFGEVDCDFESTPVTYSTFFNTVNTVDTCQECVPVTVEETVVLSGRIVYPERINVMVPSETIERISCTFATAIYQKMIRERYGLKSCCDINVIDAQIDFEILKLDLVDEYDLCCPEI